MFEQRLQICIRTENSIEETIQDMSALVIADLAKLPHIF
jgi:hypothetical protein